MVRLIERSVCSINEVEDYWDVHFSCVTVEGRVVDFNMDGFSSFSSNLFAVLVYYHEVGDIGSWGVVRNDVYVNCIGEMTIAFFYPIFQTSAGLYYARKVAIFF